jgi:plastocyanin
VLAVALALTFAPPALAGDIAGQVLIAQPPVEEQNREEYAMSEGGEVVETAPQPNAVEEVVIYLEGRAAGRGVHPAPVMSQRDKTFVPRVLPVKIGTTVRFPNDDQFFHNVFSLSRVRPFDLGKYNTGDARSQTFAEPGLVKLFCEIHARMKGFVLVLETDAFTVPDASGQFRLTGVPSGQYTLVAWHPAFGPKTMRVTVGPGLSRADIRF